MAKILDRILLFIYSLSIGILSIVTILLVTKAIPFDFGSIGENNLITASVIVGCILFLLSLRFLYISIKRDRHSLTSIDQRTEFGDIQISVETIENLAFKAASRVRGIRDVKTRIRITEAGLEIMIRALVDGESAIPALTEEVQKQVHEYVEEITGIPVYNVSVYIANVVQSPVIKSRVE